MGLATALKRLRVDPNSGALSYLLNGSAVPVGVGAAAGIGSQIFCDPLNGSDNNPGTSVGQALASLAAAHALAVDGHNDTVFLVGNGGTTATARPTAKIAWSKNATHLVGIAAPGYNQRARISSLSGGTAFTPMVEVTGSGCIFSNVSIFNGFDTGAANQICWRDTGSRNYYEDMWFGGMADAASAASAGSRAFLLEGAESKFLRCTFGLDTVVRSAASAALEFKTSSCKRNTFTECLFPSDVSSADACAVLVALAAASDRWQLFDRCVFLNVIKSGSTAMTGAVKLAASIGGLIAMKSCTFIGYTKVGYDATSLAQIYVDGGPAVAATSGLAVNPA